MKKPDAAAAAIEQDLRALEGGADEYVPEVIAPTSPVGGAPGEWQPNPARIIRFKPKAAMVYAVLCDKWAKAAECPALAADPAELDGVSQALAEAADALLPVDDGKPTRAGTVLGGGAVVFGMYLMKSATLQAHREALAARDKESATDAAHG